MPNNEKIEILPENIRVVLADTLSIWEAYMTASITGDPVDTKFQVGLALMDMGKQIAGQAYALQKSRVRGNEPIN